MVYVAPGMYYRLFVIVKNISFKNVSYIIVALTRFLHYIIFLIIDYIIIEI